MIRTLSRLGLLFAVLLSVGLLTSKPAHAVVVCSDTSPALNFGTVNVSPATGITGTGSIGYTCTNYNTTAANFSICAGLGTPSYPGTVSQPAMAGSSSGGVLKFNLYTNAPNGIVWTTTNPISAPVSIAGGIGNVVTGALTFYGAIPGSQTSAADSYSGSFYNMTLGFISGTSCGALTGYSGLTFTLPVTAVVSKTCTVSAGVALNIGSVPSNGTGIQGNTTIGVTCPTSTPYYVGLSPSNANLNGAGVMSSTSSGTDKVPYQLRATSGTGPIWGNTATSTSVGNGVAGTGTGVQQSLTVYASLASAQYTPGSYADTVTVNVNY
jgi:spore coat protein U-like protein